MPYQAATGWRWRAHGSYRAQASWCPGVHADEGCAAPDQAAVGSHRLAVADVAGQQVGAGSVMPEHAC